MDPFFKDSVRRAFDHFILPEVEYAEKKHVNLPIHDPCRVIAILTEEVGEAAEEALDMTRDRNSEVAKRAARERYIHEMTQVAAVAVRAVAMEVAKS